jgi:CRP/FNR family transcriptional regulator, cyclic AMP receptor protein
MGPMGSMRQARLVQAVRSSPLLGRLPDAELADVLSVARSVHADRGANVRRSDDDSVLLLLDGVAVATLPSHDGTEVVTAILGPGACSGLSVVLGSLEGDADVAALEPVDALHLPGPEFRRSLAAHPGLALATMRTLAAEVATVRQETARFAYTSTTERVLARLVELAETWGEPKDGEIRITIPLTQEMLASWARASRESTAKVLHDLRKAKVIRTARRELTILDLDRLQRRATATDEGEELVRTLLHAIS